MSSSMSSTTTTTTTMPNSSTRPPFISYSSFFASGLLAANTPLRVRRSTVSSTHSTSSFSDFSSNEHEHDSDAYYASRSDNDDGGDSSPLDGRHKMDVVEDAPTPDAQSMNSLAAAQRRSATPTPLTLQMKAAGAGGDTTPVQSPQPANATIQSTTTTTTPASAGPPRLRRRKSSLTMAASPISAIRSSTRTAKHQQECMQKAAPAVHARARSGSLQNSSSVGGGAPVSPGAALVYGVNALSVMSAATEATSMLGRMRSGSCSNAVVVVAPPPPLPSASTSSGSSSRPRRSARRVPTASFPAPRAPPPNVPLPALPGLPVPPSPSTPSFSAKRPSASSVSKTSARARGLSVSSSTLSGEENWINEER